MLDAWFITGFCEEGGIFTYSRSGRTFNLYFSIKQEEENRQLVEDISIFFNSVGEIYTNKRTKISATGLINNAYVYYRVTKIKELVRIVEHFDKYPFKGKKKQISYKTWREMFQYKMTNYRKINFEKLNTLAMQFSQRKDV